MSERRFQAVDTGAMVAPPVFRFEHPPHAGSVGSCTVWVLADRL